MSNSHEFGFLADGYDRAYSAVEPHVRRDIEGEFGEQLRAASSGERKRLLREIEKLITERVRELAPPDALY